MVDRPEVVEEEDFKVRYNQMLQQFKELKEREKANDIRHRQLNEELDGFEKKNTDLMIKIKMIESQLNGSSESDIATLFEGEIKAKADKIAQLEAYSPPIIRRKKLEQAQAAKRKNEQNEAIIAKLKNTIKEKEALLSEKESEYNQTISATSELSKQVQAVPQESVDFEKKKKELEDRLAQVEGELKAENEKAEALKRQIESGGQAEQELNVLEGKARQLQQQRAEEEAAQRNHIKELEQLITSGAIVKEVADKYEPLIKEAEAKRAAAIQEIERLRESASHEEQEITSLNRQIKEISDKIRDYKKLKEEVDRSNKEVAKLKKEEQLQKGRIVSNSNKVANTQQQIKELETQSNELKSLLKVARQRNETLKKENTSAQAQLEELKAKTSKNDPKEYETLRRQKESLEGELTREKSRYEALKELQKTYYPESALKDLKSTYEELRQKTLNLPNLQRENKKLKEEYTQVQRKIDELKQRDQQTIDELSSQSKQLEAKIEELERTHATISKTLNETNTKVAAYAKNFPNHEQEKLRRKQQQKRLLEEQAKEKKQKKTEKDAAEVKQKRRPKEEQEEPLTSAAPEADNSSGTTVSATKIKTNIQQYEYIGLLGLVVLALVIYIFR